MHAGDGYAHHYRCAYRKKAGDDWYVYTSFTPIDARRAFPCFDEPGYKASWAVTLHVKKSDVAVANGPEVSSTEEADGMKRVVFKETQPLASEVVAFAAGPFDVVEKGSSADYYAAGPSRRGWARKGSNSGVIAARRGLYRNSLSVGQTGSYCSAGSAVRCH
jgi:aminopeptidase N